MLSGNASLLLGLVGLKYMFCVKKRNSVSTVAGNYLSGSKQKIEH